MRIVAAILLALALAACGQGADAGDDGDEGVAGGTDLAGTTCAEAWAALSQEDLTEAQNLDEGVDVLDDTITACPSAQEWAAQAIENLEGINDSAALIFLEGRCRANPELAHVNSCATPAAS